ncbi:GSCFA domain-containing protein [Candidatus Rhodobacter oscarellae]|nr:GSCFA domain-containing protein [Candidatus Rhodobacter lobularis]
MRSEIENPYTNLPPSAFWRSAIADVGLFGLQDLWEGKLDINETCRFATFGSCFAQHISRALVERKLNWINAEPAPGRTPASLASRYNYGIFSARTANIYTARQLLEWAKLANATEYAENIEVWEDGGCFRDSLRPMIEPNGFKDRTQTIAMLQSTARAFRAAITEADVFVFTLGLTEGWENKKNGQPYGLCPGTLAGTYDQETHVFKNYRYPDVMAHLEEALEILWTLNPSLQFLFTVSPVPLTATANPGTHVLVATTYSKSVLRAVASDMAQNHSRIDYFPSYEIITGTPTRAMFFEPNMRSVSPYGVRFVMEHFFTGLGISAPPSSENDDEKQQLEMVADEQDVVCEEMILEQYNGR